MTPARRSGSVPSRLGAEARAAALQALGLTPFDVLVIGGGITGAGIARDAALRGLTVALVERDDFASGTSSRSSRLIHGGLRYLEHGQFHLVFESLRERHVLRGIAPHLVRPLQFTWPVYRQARVPLWKLRLGLFVYDALALARNVGRHRMLSSQLVGALEPALRPMDMTGGATYFDACTDDARLTFATVRAAADARATVVNHAAVRELVRQQDEVRGAVVEDLLHGGRTTVTARCVVNATGPWSDTIRRLAQPESASSVRGTKGAHIAVPRARVGNNAAVTITSPIDGRVMFVLPAADFTVIGTTDTDYSGPLDAVRATSADIVYLLRSANAYFPDAHLTASDVVSAWAGIRPLVPSGAREPASVSREHAISWSAPGLLSVTGGKLTTYRAMAVEVVDEIAKRLHRGRARAPTATRALPGGTIADLDAELDAATEKVRNAALASHLVHRHGTQWRDVWRLACEDAGLSERVVPELPYLRAEAVWAATRELALTLGDVLIRRLPLAYETRDHGLEVAEDIARLLAPHLGWDDAQCAREVDRYAAEIESRFAVLEA